MVERRVRGLDKAEQIEALLLVRERKKSICMCVGWSLLKKEKKEEEQSFGSRGIQ